MIIGILVKGHDYGGLGLDMAELSIEVEKRIDLINDLGLDATGMVMQGGDHTAETTVSFVVYRRGDSLSFDEWLEFNLMYRQSYATFDGHIFMADIDHQTSTMIKEGIEGIHLHLCDL